MLFFLNSENENPAVAYIRDPALFHLNSYTKFCLSVVDCRFEPDDWGRWFRQGRCRLHVKQPFQQEEMSRLERFSAMRRSHQSPGIPRVYVLKVWKVSVWSRSRGPRLVASLGQWMSPLFFFGSCILPLPSLMIPSLPYQWKHFTWCPETWYGPLWRRHMVPSWQPFLHSEKRRLSHDDHSTWCVEHNGQEQQPFLGGKEDSGNILSCRRGSPPSIRG